MKKKKAVLKIGDSVVVREGVMDPDNEDFCIAGWQGRILELSRESGHSMIRIGWDSATLKNIPDDILERNEEEGLDWREMYLTEKEVEPVSHRDTEKEVQNISKEIEKKFHWCCLGEEGKRIQKILKGIDPDDEWKQLEAWEKYLSKHLKFPFSGKTTIRQGPIKHDVQVKVKGITLADDHYGIIVGIKWEKGNNDYPLGLLDVTNKKSSNFQLVRGYSVWFSNH